MGTNGNSSSQPTVHKLVDGRMGEMRHRAPTGNVSDQRRRELPQPYARRLGQLLRAAGDAVRASWDSYLRHGSGKGLGTLHP